MGYYRRVYLKSEDWRDLRGAVVADRAPDGRCEVCQKPCEKLDVHHLVYRRLYNVLPWDLRAVCRTCHDAIHALLKEAPQLKEMGRGKAWGLILSRLRGIPIKGWHSWAWKKFDEGDKKVLTLPSREIKTLALMDRK